MTDGPKELTRRWIDLAWNRADSKVIHQLLAPSTVLHGLLDPRHEEIVGPHSFALWLQNMRTALPDLGVGIDEILLEQNKVAVRCTLRGLHLGEGLGVPPTHVSILIDVFMLLHFQNGQISGSWHHLDLHELYVQLGVWPPMP